MSATLLSILSGIAGMLGWGTHDFLGGIFARQIGPLKSFFWSQLAGLVSILLLALVLAKGIHVPPLVAVLLPVAAIMYCGGYLLFFKGLEIGNLSIVASTLNLWAVFTMLFAFLFMGQRLSTMQLIGVVMILLGTTAASLNWSELGTGSLRLSAGVRESVLGALFFGIFWNLSQVISETTGWLFTTLFVKAGIVLFLLAFALLAKREIGIAQSPARTKYALVLMGVIEVSAVAVVNYGLTVGDAILISPIASALSIVTILLAMIFLKDRVTRLQGLGIVTVIAGVVVTAF